MRWDGQAYASVVKSGLYELFANQIPQASIMGNKEYADYLKNNCEYSTILGHNPNVKGMITIKAVNLFANDNGIEIDFINRILNCNNDTSITLSWSLAARHIRAWEYEKRSSELQQENIPQKKSAKEQWDSTHLCKNYTDNYTVETHCEYFLQTKSEDTVINGRKLDRSCYYCTSENKIRKIGGGGSWTGLSPKFCPKRKALEQEQKTDEKSAPPTYFDVFLQHYPHFDVDRFDEFVNDVCTAECFDDVNSRLGNTAGKHDFACKIDCSECWKNECKLQWKLTEGTEKYIEPYLTAEKEEDKMTPNFNFKGFISEGNQLKQVPLDMLVPYHNHKFKLYEGERLTDMVNSIKENGVLTPIIVRNMGGEHYEILAGHNRTNAARLAGLTVIPAIVKENLSDDEAEMYVIETNVMQRGFDDLSISERAAVIAARHSAMFDDDKRRAIERELAALNGNAPADEDEEQENGEKKSKLAAVGESYGLSKDSVARLIRIDKLSDELKSYVDSGDIPLRAGVNLSYLVPSEQKMLVKVMIDCVNTKISMKQSELLRELSREKNLTENNVREVVLTGKLTDHSAPTLRKPIKVKISADIGAKYFSPNWNEDKVRQIVELALEQYFTNTDRLIMDENDEYQI